MSSLWRTVWGRDRKLIGAALSMAAALSLAAVSLGAIAVSKGVPLWMVTLLGLTVFAGGAELMAVGLMTGGAAPITTILGCLLLNARFFPFGLAIGDVLRGSWATRLFGSHLLVDETAAFALAETEPERRKRAYWISGLALYCTWTPAVFVGGLLGQRIGDPEVFGLDAALPAALLALIMPSLRDRPTLRAVALGALLAVATTPLLPEGLPVMLGLAGVAAALPLPVWTGARR